MDDSHLADWYGYCRLCGTNPEDRRAGLPVINTTERYDKEALLTEVRDPDGTATGRCGGPVLKSFLGGSLDVEPLLGPAARNGELTDRLAGIEAEKADAG